MEATGLIAVVIVSGLLSCLVSFLITKLSHRYEIFNNLEERDHKERKILRVGGIAIFASLFISLLMIRIVFNNSFKEIDKSVDSYLLAIAIIIIFALGIFDDLKGVNVSIKLLFQTIAAVIIYLGGFKIAEISIPFIGTKSIGIHLLPFLLTILWVVGITNAVNILDGLDGLAAGVSFFAVLSLGILAFFSSQFQIVFIIAALLGAIIGFYPYNFPRAKIYLGDSGSLLIGFILAVLSMAKIHRKGSLAIALMIPIIILFLPILETLVTIVRRMHKKKSIFIGDRDHLHYRFLRKGFSETKTTLVLIFISCLFSLSGILFEFVQRKLRITLFVLVFLICFFLLNYLGYININSKKLKLEE